MSLIENMIQLKLKSLTGKQLMKVSNALELGITEEQAEKIALYFKKNTIDIYKDQDRAKVIKEIAKIAGPEPAKKINRMVISLMK